MKSASTQGRVLVRLEDPSALEPGRVGQKAAALARARQAGLPVPPTLVVPVEAQEAAGEGLHPGLAAELAAAAVELDRAHGLAVRSSAVAEDLADGSFAGVYESFLGVRGGEAVARAVEACRASAGSQVVRAYLEEKGRPPEASGMAVILQPTLQAAAAGVAFSRNPIYPERDEVVVEAVSGLGDRLAAGAVSPHRAFLGPDGPPRVEPPAGGRAEEPPPLDPTGWRAVADLARRAEAMAGVPQDVEWALDREGRLWLLQCRPVTTLGQGPEAGAPSGVWTRALAVDLWADRLTPFLAAVMLAGAPRWDLTPAATTVGVPVVRPTLAVIAGYLYVNAESLRSALSVLPRPLRLPRLAELFPPGLHLDDLPSLGPGRLVILGLRALGFGLVTPQSNPLLCLGLTRRRMKRLEAEVEAEVEALVSQADGTPQAALATVRRAVELLVRHQEANQWGYTWATVLTWVFRHGVTAWGEVSEEGFLQLLGEGADNVTLTVQRQLQRLAGRVAADPQLRQRLAEGGAHALLSAPSIRGELDRFLQRFGCRARGRSLSIPRWAEDPGEVAALVAGMVPREAHAGSTESGSLGSAQPAAGRRQEAEAVWRRLPPTRRFLLRRLQRLTRRYLDLREELRFHLDGALFLLRRSLLALGEVTGLGEGVLDLTLEELAGVVEGNADRTAAGERAARRREELGAPASAPSFYVEGRPVEGLPAHRGDLLRGVGTSSGRATGRARIVTDPTDDALADGDVLVAVHADPGWTPVLSRVAGIVLEEGGLLNHCSIVARELGIPAVVGVRGATRRIPDGTRLTLDGGQGWVLLQGAQAGARS